MIEIFVLGQPFWGQRIARALDAPPDGMRAAYVPQGGYARLLARPRSDRVFLVRAGYRIGATTTRGRIFDAYWSLLCRSLRNAVRCHYWLGSDVLDTVEEARAGTLRLAAVRGTGHDLHLADAPWLVSELESVGIHAVTAHVPAAHRAPSSAPALPAEFSVLTYLAAHRFEFYGGDAILAAARRLPDVRFDVVGATGAPDRQSPSNVRWHGWVTDMPRYYANATVVVRIPRHDGLGETVVEGLLNARHVLYTHEVPFVRTVWPATPDSVVAELGALRDEHLAGRLEANVAGRAYALEAFDESKLARDLAGLLRERA
jgi:glycosyltransferase involved in cell wall biosynthesis